MDRLIRSSQGFTLLELVIAIALGSVVLLTSSNFLINFAKYSANLVKGEASLMGTALGAYEEIVYRITHANKAVVQNEPIMDIPSTARPAGCATDGTCIQIRLDRVAPTSPSTYTDDTVYNYWKSGSNLYRSECSTALGGCLASSVIATDITSLLFTRTGTAMNPEFNSIRVSVEAQVTSGATAGVVKESMATVAVLRSKSVGQT